MFKLEGRSADGSSTTQRAGVARRWRGGAIALALCAAGLFWHGSARGSRLSLTERQLCAAQWVVVATVAEAESFLDPRPGHNVATLYAFRVEAVAHGSPPPIVKLVQRGGTLNGATTTNSDALHARIGERYLLALRTRSLGDAPRPEDSATPTLAPAHQRMQDEMGVDVLLVNEFALDPTRDLPISGAVMEAIWEEHCGTGPITSPEARPTRNILEYIPEGLLQLCEHY